MSTPTADLRDLHARIANARSKASELWVDSDAKHAHAIATAAPHGSPAFQAYQASHEAYSTAAATVSKLEEQRDRLLASGARTAGPGDEGLNGPEDRHDGGHGRRAGYRPTSDGGYEAGSWLASELRAFADAQPNAAARIAEGSGIGAAVTPVQHAGFIWDRLAPEAVALASGMTILEIDGKSVIVPRVSQDPAAEWVLEGEEIPESAPAGEPIEATPRKLGVITRITLEAYTDAISVRGRSAALAVAEQTMLRDMSLRLDLGIFQGNGVAPQPRGLSNTPGIAVVSMGANGAAITNLDPIIDGISVLEEANAHATAIVMAPRAWKALMKLRESDSSLKPLIAEHPGTPGTPGGVGVIRTLFNVPVYLRSGLNVAETKGTSNDTSSIYIYEAAQVVAVRRADATLTVDPSYGFSTDEIGVKVTMRYDVAVPNPAAVVRIAGVKAPAPGA